MSDSDGKIPKFKVTSKINSFISYFLDSTNAEEGAPAETKQDEGAINTVDILTFETDAIEVDLNHGRIAKIENFEPLECIEK